MNITALTEDTRVSALSGVGKARAEQLSRLGIATLRDLIYFFPRAYERRGDIKLLSEFEPERNCAFILTVATEVRSAKLRGNLTVSKFRAFDDSGSVEISFFNSPYIKDVFHIGSVFRFWGKASFIGRKLQMTNPKYEPYVEGIPLADLVPIYPQTEGLSSKQIDKLIKQAVNDALPSISDPLPDEIRLNCGLPTLTYALLNAHFPESDEALRRAQTRLAFDEMLYFGIGISMSAMQKNRGEGARFSPCSLEPVTSTLPYELTDAQKSAVNDIYRDTVIGHDGKISPMARIIVGDVGCGKTICSVLAMYIAARSGYQSALMVPTEILARQHFKEAVSLLSPLGIRVELLLGSTTQKEKTRIRAQAAAGEAQILIGTHALLSDKLDFANLGLVITDEQHRFGVAQRAMLKQKSSTAHLLVMSATPIPRTLALAMYGDLDVSRITEMPKGRQRVDTFVVNEGYRRRLDDFISKQVAVGGRCYVVCPSIEESEDTESVIRDSIGEALTPVKSLNLKHATVYAEELKERMPHLRVGVLHGKMKGAEKDAVMKKFADGDINVLVSTTVIEVGVNVPEATLMIVENAERFGLAQLRGRVGRGNSKSYCVLVSDINSEASRARLEILRTTHDGYEIAEKDLMLRGPGDFFSSNSPENLRQSGGFEFKFASMCDDTALFEMAFSIAKAIVNSDPTLSCAEHSGIKREVDAKLFASRDTVS